MNMQHILFTTVNNADELPRSAAQFHNKSRRQLLNVKFLQENQRFASKYSRRKSLGLSTRIPK